MTPFDLAGFFLPNFLGHPVLVDVYVESSQIG